MKQENINDIRILVLNGSYIIAEKNEKNEYIDKKIQPAPDNLKSGIYRLKEAKIPSPGKECKGVVVFSNELNAVTFDKGRLFKHDNKKLNLKLGQNVSIDYSKKQPTVTIDKKEITKTRTRTR